MATAADMLEKAANALLDPFTINLTRTKQYDRDTWVLSGKAHVLMPDGTKRYLYDVEIVETAND